MTCSNATPNTPKRFISILTLLLGLFLLPLAAHAQVIMDVENAGGATALALSADGSFAVGAGTTAGGSASLAMGAGTTASGNFSTAMGEGTTASGIHSTAIGFNTVASNFNTVAMGYFTEASGLHSVVMGDRTIAASPKSLSIGQFNNANSTADGTAFVVGNGTDDANRSDALVLSMAGDLTIAGTLTQSSDRRLKEDIAPLGSVLQKLEGVTPVAFRFKEGVHRSTDPQIGLIAQDVRKAFPKLVGEGSNGYLTVSYTNFTAVLLKGLQEQQAQIEALQAEVEALRGGPVAAPLAGLLPVAGLLLGGLFVGGVVVWRRRGPLG